MSLSRLSTRYKIVPVSSKPIGEVVNVSSIPISMNGFQKESPAFSRSSLPPSSVTRVANRTLKSSSVMYPANPSFSCTSVLFPVSILTLYISSTEDHDHLETVASHSRIWGLFLGIVLVHRRKVLNLSSDACVC